MEIIEDVVSMLNDSKNTVALTGAGISKAAGIPTFRDVGGLWSQDEVIKWANRRSFNKDPADWYETFWKFYERRQHTVPSLAHYALKDLVQASRLDAIVTQNVDGLDLLAGTPPDSVFEIHGHDRALSCTVCDYHVATKSWLVHHHKIEVPQCPDNHLLKPDLLLFGVDSVPGLPKIRNAAVNRVNEADTLLVAGTSLEIPSIAELILDFAAQDKDVIIINSKRTIADAIASLVIHASTEDIIPTIRDEMIN
jgi:NAD-dependent deacetylase